MPAVRQLLGFAGAAFAVDMVVIDRCEGSFLANTIGMTRYALSKIRSLPRWRRKMVAVDRVQIWRVDLDDARVAPHQYHQHLPDRQSHYPPRWGA